MPDLNSLSNPNLQVPSGQTTPQESLFFNVMPRGKTGSALIQPQIKIEAENQDFDAGKTNTWDKIKKYKLYFFIFVVAAVAGVAIYFLINKIEQNSYTSSAILANIQGSGKISTTTPVSKPGFSTPQVWRDRFFPGCSDIQICGDETDPDHDGLANLDEFKLHTDPNNADSDQDGLADGDEVHVFGSNPLNAHTADSAKFTDLDFFKGGFVLKTNQKMTAGEISEIAKKMQEFGLHQPTITSVGNTLVSLYGFTPALDSTQTATSTLQDLTASSTIVAGVDQSSAAKQGRDAQRSNTITNIEEGLVKYYADNGSYPPDPDFALMSNDIKPYLKIATNLADPINKDPYLYSYSANASSSDFALSFYSETQSQVITKNAAAAQADSKKEQANIFDNQRETDLQSLRLALLLYSNDNVAGEQTYVFPTTDKYKTALVPKYTNQIPKDPKSGQDYSYQVSSTFNTFTLKALLDAPQAGATGYMCNQDDCGGY
jgi:hypothetical protein